MRTPSKHGTIATMMLLTLMSGIALGKRSWIFLLAKTGATAVMASSAGLNQAMNPKKPALASTSQKSPWINLTEPVSLSAQYLGSYAGKSALALNQVRPLALSSADFDEDGMPNLISGFGTSEGGVIVLQQGNVDSIFPNTPEAKSRKARGEFTDSPFFPAARVFEVPEAPDFLGVGDFDADGHQDIVTAARGSHALYFLQGDGRGGFATAQPIELHGKVSVLEAGEINRADGLTDLVVGIVGTDGPEALVFESPEGALKSTPEHILLPAEASSLALGLLDRDEWWDLAVAAGQELVIVHGRDRKLSLDESQRATVAPPLVSHRAFPFAVKSVAAGYFTGDQEISLALLTDEGTVEVLRPDDAKEKSLLGSSLYEIQNWRLQTRAKSAYPHATQLVRARLSSRAGDDVVIIDPTRTQLQMLEGFKETLPPETAVNSKFAEAPAAFSISLDSEPVAVLPMRLNVSALNGLVILRKNQSAVDVVSPQATITITVLNTNDSGAGSLRQAILDANANPGADRINFSPSLNVGPDGTITVSWLSPPPAITDAVTIDGTTAPGFISLDGGQTTSFTFDGPIISGGNSVLRNLGVGRFGTGVELITNGNNHIEGCWVGIRVTNTPFWDGFDGVDILGGSPNNVIGGTVSAARNVISGNKGGGIFFGGGPGNSIVGNFIGLDPDGIAALGNAQFGVRIGSNNNVVGGTLPGSDNIISGNLLAGIHIGPGAGGNLLERNFVGIDPHRLELHRANFNSGIVIEAQNNTVGGTSPGAGNVISGNTGSGVVLLGPFATGNLLQGNFIGTNPAGTASIPNTLDGVSIRNGASNNFIGGIVFDARNFISGNTQDGINIDSTNGTMIQGNFIGTDFTGLAPLANTRDGLRIFGNNNYTGGISIGAGNFIGFNGGNGVTILSGTGNLIRSNSIFSNVKLPIDLGNDGVTPNHPGCLATGANNLLNFPVLVIAQSSSDNTTVQATFNCTGPKPYDIEFTTPLNLRFKNSGGIQIPNAVIGVKRFVTDSNGNATLNITLPGGLVGQTIAATVSDPATNNTSEFSAPIQVQSVPLGVSSQVNLELSAGGSNTTSTFLSAGAVQAGYATVTGAFAKRDDTAIGGNIPYGTAVFSLTQGGTVVTEAGVPASPPTTKARIFIDFRTAVTGKSDDLDATTTDTNTGFAVVNMGLLTANILYTLRDVNSGLLTPIGHGTLPPGAHRAKFIDQLSDLAPDFVFPSNFATAAQFGTLEIQSDQPLSILALRLTTNQRGETLLTSTPIADLTKALTTAILYFAQLVDGAGYKTTIVLLNTSNTTETGTLKTLSDNGSPLVVHQVGGPTASSFNYNIPSGGVFVFQTDGSPATVNAGSVQVTPDPGTSTPVGAGLFRLKQNGVVVTESGIPSATPTTHARIYIDKSAGHDTGIAIAAPTGTGLNVTLSAFLTDGSTPAGTSLGPLALNGNGHTARFVGELISGLPAGFTGVLDISSASAFVALTLRSLTNSRSDFLLTTFPIADFNLLAPFPIVFPQIAVGGGYRTQFIVLSAGGASSTTLNFLGDDGAPLVIGKSSRRE